jgi:hypothetical protein
VVDHLLGGGGSDGEVEILGGPGGEVETELHRHTTLEGY